jgi:hypothetical protein
MNDIRLGLRLCLRHPVLSLAAILSLALGIGANTARFTVLNGSVLRPLPYAEPDQLMVVWETNADQPRRPVAPANFLDWRRETQAFTALAAFDDFSATLTAYGDVASGSGDVASGSGNVVSGFSRTVPAAQRLRAVSASANFFDVLGVTAQVGRVMTAADDDPGAQRVAVLTDVVASPVRRRGERTRANADPQRHPSHHRRRAAGVVRPADGPRGGGVDDRGPRHSPQLSVPG